MIHGIIGKCLKLSSVAIKGNNPNYKIIDDVLYDSNVTTIICYPTARKSKEYEIPDTVQWFSYSYVFQYIDDLKIFASQQIYEKLLEGYTRQGDNEVFYESYNVQLYCNSTDEDIIYEVERIQNDMQIEARRELEERIKDLRASGDVEEVHEMGDVEYVGRGEWQIEIMVKYNYDERLVHRDFGYKVTTSYITTVIDDDLPTISAIGGNSDVWTKSNITLTVQAQDEGAGLAREAYSFDGGQTWQTSNQKVYKGNEQNISIKVKDKIGNIATATTVNITKIDKDAPIIQAVSGIPKIWTENDVTIKIQAQDTGVGLAREAYSFDGGQTWQESNMKTYTNNTNGITIAVRDALENIVTVESFNIDKIIELQKIEIKQKPTKLRYYKGEKLDTTGMILKVTYNKGVEDVTSGYNCSQVNLNELGEKEVIVEYKGKTTSFKINVVEKEIDLSSSIYQITNEYVKKIQPNTTVEIFLKNISTNATDIKVYKENQEVTKTNIITTGMKLILDNKVQFLLITIGDCNKDGKADINDILLMNKHRLNKAKLDAVLALSGDINDDNVVDIQDILLLNKYRLGKINKL